MFPGGLIKMKKPAPAAVKLIFIGLVIIILCIANGLITSKMNERERTYKKAQDEIASSAGGAFSISTVRIAIPYDEKKTVYENGVAVKKTVSGTKLFKPDEVKYDARLDSEVRSLGIYQSPIYTGSLGIKAAFSLPSLTAEEDIVYYPEDAVMVVSLKSSSLLEKPYFTINGEVSRCTFYSDGGLSGIACAFTVPDSGECTLSATLNIRGASSFLVNLDSSETTLNVTSDWISPGFTGFDYLPDTRELTDSGFSASWKVPYAMAFEKIGFTFVEPVNLYQRLHRAQNYAFLFIIVPFIVLFLFEIFLHLNLHPVQYLLSGAASVIFFLLLLSLSEHIPFGLAYLIGAVASGLLVSLYVSSIAGKGRPGFIMSFVFLLLYSYLFFCLQSEDYALLIGSVFAFILLAVIMFLTRKVNWSNLKKQTDTDLMKA